MFSFQYAKARSLGEAQDLLSQNELAKPLAGGMSLLPMMKLRLADPPAVIDLAGLPDLRGIEVDSRCLRIGAMTRHFDVATSSTVAAAIPALVELARGIGDAQVRHRGTIGGSVAHSDPAADYPSAVLGLNASIVTSRRAIAADDYFKGLFETALEPGEIITRFEFPIPHAARYVKFANLASRFAIVGVFVARTGGEVRVAVTGASTHVFRCKPIEQALSREFSAAGLENVDVSPAGLTSDIHAPAEYRAHLIRVLAMQAVQQMA